MLSPRALLCRACTGWARLSQAAKRQPPIEGNVASARARLRSRWEGARDALRRSTSSRWSSPERPERRTSNVSGRESMSLGKRSIPWDSTGQAYPAWLPPAAKKPASTMAVDAPFRDSDRCWERRRVRNTALWRLAAGRCHPAPRDQPRRERASQPGWCNLRRDSSLPAARAVERPRPARQPRTGNQMGALGRGHCCAPRRGQQPATASGQKLNGGPVGTAGLRHGNGFRQRAGFVHVAFQRGRGEVREQLRSNQR